jgi:YgiT-type zinc finger domain-containing protein
MRCFLCKGKVEDTVAAFMVEFDQCIIVIRDVPSQVCAQCGEISYSDDVAHSLEQRVNVIKTAIKSFDEVTVVNYSDMVA